MSLLLLNEDELRQTITISEAIDVVEAAFAASAKSKVKIPGSFNLRLLEVNGEVNVTGAYLRETPYYVVKMGSNFRDNPTINLPAKSGSIAVFDAATGFPAAIMIDNGYLTNIRAGAAGALAAEYLANKAIKRVAVIGVGTQAYIQLKALMNIRNFASVSIWARSPLNADNYARQILEDHDININIAATVKEAVRDADLIITATSSTEPLIEADWLKPGTHITAVGSNKPTQRELHTNVLQRADLIVVDNFDRCITVGEIHHGFFEGNLNKKDIHGELGALIVGEISGRTQPEQITVADLTGMDIHDAVIATLAMEKALFMGLGQRVEIGITQRAPNPRIENFL